MGGERGFRWPTINLTFDDTATVELAEADPVGVLFVPALADSLAGRMEIAAFIERLCSCANRNRRCDRLGQGLVRDLARIASLDALPRLLTLAVRQTARLLTVSELAGPFSISRPTIRD